MAMDDMTPLPIGPGGAQAAPTPPATIPDLLAQPGLLATLSGTGGMSTLTALYLGLRLASDGRRVVYRDLIENATIGRALWKTGRLNGMPATGRLSVDRDPAVLDPSVAVGVVEKRLVSQLAAGRPQAVIIDDLAHALTDPSERRAGYDPLQTIRTLRAVAGKLRCAVLLLTGTEETIVDEAADVRLQVSRACKHLTLTALTAPGGDTPRPLRFELDRGGGTLAVKLIDINNDF
jgi:hypothetical protein